MTLNKGENWAFIGVELWFKICSRSTYVAEQHMFSMLLLISSNQRAILFSFWVQKIGFFDCWVQVQIVLGSTHIVQ